MYKKTNLYVNNTLLDMFEDEVIDITSSVKQLSDISKVFTEFSQSFNVPATAINNVIFKHYYDFNLKNPLDVRKKMPAYIQLDGISFVDGFIRVENVVMNYETPVSYNITFFGNLVNLTNVFKEYQLSNLKFELDHYNSDANIELGRTVGLFDKKVIYPFISRYRRWFYNSNPTTDLNDDENLNLYFHDVQNDEFKPAVKVNEIVKTIENDYGLTLNGFIKDNPKLDNLYMWLNKSDGDTVKGTTQEETMTFTWGSTFTPTNAFTFSMMSAPLVTATEVFHIAVLNATTNAVIQEAFNTSTIIVQSNWNQPIKIVVYATESIKAFGSFFTLDVTGFEGITAEYSFDAYVKIEDNFSEMKIVDFISGLVKMFNLIITSSNGKDFVFTPLDEWYGNGNIIDITRYISFKQYTVKRPTVYNQVDFKFSESSTVLAEQFYTLFGYRWGDISHKVLDEDGEQVEGEAYEIELPFQQTVYERLFDSNSGYFTDLVWSEGLGLENHLFFGIWRAGEFTPSKVNGLTGDDKVFLSFNAENEEHSRQIETRSLFEVYYKDYISDMFSIYRKELEITCMLPNNLITNLRLNDRVIVDHKRFIIEEMNINLLTGITQFKLLNDIF